SSMPQRRKKMRNAWSKMSECSWRFTNTACSVQYKSWRVPTPAAATAASTPSTAPGPTGTPAARSARAKWTMFSARRPAGRCAALPAAAAPRTSSGASTGRGAIVTNGCIAFPPVRLRRPLLSGAQLCAPLVDEILHRVAFDARDVVLIFEQYAECVRDGRGIERRHVELGERGRPVERFGDP